MKSIITKVLLIALAGVLCQPAHAMMRSVPKTPFSFSLQKKTAAIAVPVAFYAMVAYLTDRNAPDGSIKSIVTAPIWGARAAWNWLFSSKEAVPVAAGDQPPALPTTPMPLAPGASRQRPAMPATPAPQLPVKGLTNEQIGAEMKTLKALGQAGTITDAQTERYKQLKAEAQERLNALKSEQEEKAFHGACQAFEQAQKENNLDGMKTAYQEASKVCEHPHSAEFRTERFNKLREMSFSGISLNPNFMQTSPATQQRTQRAPQHGAPSVSNAQLAQADAARQARLAQRSAPATPTPAARPAAPVVQATLAATPVVSAAAGNTVRNMKAFWKQQEQQATPAPRRAPAKVAVRR